VPYDKSFFAALKGFDVLVVPSLADEQPRVVYDAYSQAVPVLASDTAGLRQCVEHGVTGVLFAVNDAAALKESIVSLEKDRDALARFAPEAVKKARSLTHQEMHRRRWRLLASALAGRDPRR
jgi:glycosyltransferase involved in cell wall biosynthesis